MDSADNNKQFDQRAIQACSRPSSGTSSIKESLLAMTYATHHVFDENVKGRDIVVGDIHGYFSVLSLALDEIHFNPASDRLFALGDLVDRGPDNLDAIEWLAKPYFFSVAGNHDINHLLQHDSSKELDTWTKAMMDYELPRWVVESEVDRYETLLSSLKRLPLAITIHTVSGRVGLVHAGLPARHKTWGSFTDAIDNCQLPTLDVYSALWDSRYDVRDLNSRDQKAETVSDAYALFHGHTVPFHRNPVTIGNKHFIETGAYIHDAIFPGGFTLVDIRHPDKPLLSTWWPDK